LFLGIVSGFGLIHGVSRWPSDALAGMTQLSCASLTVMTRGPKKFPRDRIFFLEAVRALTVAASQASRSLGTGGSAVLVQGHYCGVEVQHLVVRAVRGVSLSCLLWGEPGRVRSGFFPGAVWVCSGVFRRMDGWGGFIRGKSG
jgi:hypothetical protein